MVKYLRKIYTEGQLKMSDKICARSVDFSTQVNIFYTAEYLSILLRIRNEVSFLGGKDILSFKPRNCSTFFSGIYIYFFFWKFFFHRNICMWKWHDAFLLWVINIEKYRCLNLFLFWVIDNEKCRCLNLFQRTSWILMNVS